MFLLRWAVKIGLLLLAGLVVYLGVTFVQVWRASNHDQAGKAEAIIVLGAAQYNGRPSPVLKARLDHAAELWRRGLAPKIVLTGGKQAQDTYTEATTGYIYLRGEGIPENALEKETQGRNSWDSLAAAANILLREGANDVLLVTDDYHAFRVAAIARELGLKARVSPAPTHLSRTGELRKLARETAAVSVGRIIGYRRLVRIERVRTQAASGYRLHSIRSGVV